MFVCECMGVSLVRCAASFVTLKCEGDIFQWRLLQAQTVLAREDPHDSIAHKSKRRFALLFGHAEFSRSPIGIRHTEIKRRS